MDIRVYASVVPLFLVQCLHSLLLSQSNYNDIFRVQFAFFAAH